MGRELVLGCAAMQTGIVGLPQGRKTTLFRILTRAQSMKSPRGRPRT